MSKILIFTGALIAVLPSSANATCGTRGGPGFRDPETGKCQSWADVQRKCGPDGSRCQREQESPYFQQLPKRSAYELMQCAHGLRNDCQ
jgi:hypothetical protein